MAAGNKIEREMECYTQQEMRMYEYFSLKGPHREARFKTVNFNAKQKSIAVKQALEYANLMLGKIQEKLLNVDWSIPLDNPEMREQDYDLMEAMIEYKYTKLIIKDVNGKVFKCTFRVKMVPNTVKTDRALVYWYREEIADPYEGVDPGMICSITFYQEIKLEA